MLITDYLKEECIDIYLSGENKEDYSHRGKINAERYKSYLNGLAYGPRDDIRHQ